MIILQVTPEELKLMIRDAVQSAVSSYPVNKEAMPKEPLIKGIHALSRYLGISPARAQQLKNSKAIPCFQDGRIVLFDPIKVREYLHGKM
jgi:hypothetical protein